MLNLRSLRLEKGLKQSELAKIIGVENYTIGNWERDRAEPSISDLIKLSHYFECSIDTIVGNEDLFSINKFAENDLIKDILKELMQLNNDDKNQILGFIKGIKKRNNL